MPHSVERRIAKLERTNRVLSISLALLGGLALLTLAGDPRLAHADGSWRRLREPIADKSARQHLLSEIRRRSQKLGVELVGDMLGNLIEDHLNRRLRLKLLHREFPDELEELDRRALELAEASILNTETMGPTPRKGELKELATRSRSYVRALARLEAKAAAEFDRRLAGKRSK